MKLSIVIPVYNEEKTVVSLVERVQKALKRLPPEIKSHEFVMVEDGSKDKTRDILEKNFAGKEGFVLHFQEKNQGKGAAITKGFSLTTGDIVLIQDADLEYDPNDYPLLLKPILDGNADVVFGSRFKGEICRVLYFYHSLGNSFLTLMSNIFTNLNLTDMETCYKVYRGKIIRNMILTSKRFGIEPEMTAKIAKVPRIRIYEVPISYMGRTYDEGKKIGWKDGVSAIYCILKFNLFTGYSDSFKKEPKDLLS